MNHEAHPNPVYKGGQLQGFEILRTERTGVSRRYEADQSSNGLYRTRKEVRAACAELNARRWPELTTWS